MDLEQSSLINEIKQGKELANQIKKHLDKTSPKNCEFLLEKLLSSYEKSLSMLNWGDFMGDQLPFDSLAGNTSPRTEKFRHKHQCRKDIFKKRKVTMSKQVQVCSVQKGQLDDGYTWRKYGQKEILGANFPRAYYRCSYRHTQGCLATKQVQKSDEDPSIFEIKYRGSHTCIQTPHISSSLEKESPQPNKHHHHFQPQNKEIQEQQNDIFFKSQNTLDSEQIFPSFFNPSDQFSEHQNAENDSFSPWQLNCFGILNQNFHGSDSDYTEIISAPTSVTNSPTGDFEFSVDQVNSEIDFLFDIQEFFS